MAGYVVDNEDFVSSGYVDSAYVGMAADLTYVDSGYVGVIKTGSATLSATGSVVVDALSINPGSAVLNANSSVSVDAIRIKSFSATANANSAISSSANRTRPLNATLGGDGAASIFARAIVNPGADLSASATLSTTYTRLRRHSATLIQAGDETTWETSLTWGHPRQDVWAKRFALDPSLLYRGSSSVSASATLVADGDVTAVATLTVDGAALTVTDADITRNATATITATATTNIKGNAGLIGGATINGTGTLQGAGTYQVLGVATLNAAADTDTDYIRIRNDSATINSNATFSCVARRIRTVEKQLDSNALVFVDADRIGRGTVLKAGISSMSVNALRGRGMVNYNITGTGDIYALGGKLVGFLDYEITAQASISGKLFKLVIDPYRVYTIRKEGRSLVLDQELRVYNLKSENRLNTITQETRNYMVQSETRKIQVQATTLTNVFGPLDRRDG